MFKLRLYRKSNKLPRTTFSTIACTNQSYESDILFNTLNNAGIITLNRPKDLNCLTTSMVVNIVPKLQEWEKSKSLIIAKGAGQKAFCAGGDVKLSIHKVKGPILFWHEYNLIYLISVLRIPYVSLNHGYTMGGGLGISVPGKYRVVTEKSQMAMPENKIGLCPDVGGTYFLPRLKSRLGFYLGLTGEVLKGNDAVKAGLATHFVASKNLPDLEKQISACIIESELISTLAKFSEKQPEFSLEPHIKEIEYCFSGETLDNIMERLESTNTDWSIKTLESLHKVCPGSLKVTFQALKAGASMNLRDCLRMEYRLTCHATENHDFAEGVRARLIDKDNNPRWNPINLSDVTTQYVAKFFEKSPDRNDLNFYISKRLP